MSRNSTDLVMQIDPFSDGKFSVSGREGAQVAPNGKVYYENEDVNLKVVNCAIG